MILPQSQDRAVVVFHVWPSLAYGTRLAAALLYVDDGILTARPFDPERLSFTGDPVALVEGVTQSVDALWGGALFSVSDEGTLMFARGVSEHRAIAQMQWLDREGNALETVGEVESYNSVRISKQGTHVATSIGDPGEIWIHDIERENVTASSRST